MEIPGSSGEGGGGAGVAGTRAGDTGRPVPFDPYYESLFDGVWMFGGKHWISFHKDARFEQRYLVADPGMFTETVAHVRARPEHVVERLRGPWIWWRNGGVENRHEAADGTVTFDLLPTGSIIRVHEKMSPATSRANGGYRVRFDLSGDAEGPAYFDVTLRADGQTQIAGRFAGVKNHVWFLTTTRFAKNHLLAERGGFSFPFPSGTGWPGLIDELEK